MAKNSNISNADGAQIVKRVYDEANDAIRIEISPGTSFGFDLTSDTDSITALPSAAQVKASVSEASEGVVLAPITCVGMKSFSLFTNTTSDISVSEICTLQVSPSDTDDVWLNTTLSITPSLHTGTVIMATASSPIIARRMQVVINSSITSGSFDLYLNASST